VYPNGRDQFIADPEWVKLCGERNWVIVSGDKRLETQPENRQAVIDAKVRVFILSDSESMPEQWAAAVIVGHYKIQEVIDGNVGPFFASIGLRADGHVTRVRFPRGYVNPDAGIAAEESPSVEVKVESALRSDESQISSKPTAPKTPSDHPTKAKSGTLFN
jgi:hypothetical protein